jgi:hypothetical protein
MFDLTPEYDLLRKYDRRIFWLTVTQEAAIVALIAFVAAWVLV